MNLRSDLFVIAAVAKGGEPLLVRELTDLGARARIRAPGAVVCRGDRETIDRVLAECRCASQLRLRIAAGSPAECDEVVANFSWQEWAPLSAESAILVKEEQKSGISLSIDLDPLRAIPHSDGAGIPASLRALALRAAQAREDEVIRHYPDGDSGESDSGEGESLVICAYAKRVEEAELHDLAAHFRDHRRARHVILAHETDLDSLLARAATRKWSLEDGETSWSIHFYDPADRSVAGPAPRFRGRPLEPERFSTPSIGPTEDEARFEPLLAGNAWLRRRWPERQKLDCYRLYDRDLTTIPWAVDRYGDALHVTVYPPSRGEVVIGGPEREKRLLHAAGEALAIDPSNVFVKHKAKRAQGEQHEVQERANHSRIVTEFGLQFRVNLSDYVDTGLFLDHRLTRSQVRDEVRGKRFLNLFSYTGSFTVSAAAGGAISTTSVDTSAVYLDWARENLRRNDFEGSEHQLIRSDAMEFLRTLSVEERFDWAVVDPPTRSSRHGSSVWDVERDHGALLELLLPRMLPGGVVIFSTNFRRFRPDFPPPPGWKVEETTPGSIPSDFHDRKIHRAWRWVHQG